MAEIQLIPSAKRQGNVTSAIATIPPSVKTCKLTFPLAVADKIDPTMAFDFRLERSEDGGTTWKLVGGGRWVGGDRTDSSGIANPDPWIQLPIGLYVGQKIRLLTTIDKNLLISAKVDVT